MGSRTDPPDDEGASTLPGSDITPGGDEPIGQLARGRVLADRYRIEHLLGRGGMGEVYAAHDVLIDQPVAVKVVGAGRSPRLRALLRDELRASQALTHASIARTHTLEEMDGDLFIVMERLAGETLSQRIAHGPLPLARALAICDRLLDALGAAHARGIVHRDVKPGNVMLCDDGRVVLMDFGLARLDEPGSDPGKGTGAQSTSIKGTPAYMAPEVVAGRRADARSDLYAVGLILFEMITGEPSFKARRAEELLHRQLHDPLDVARIGRRAPQRIARVIARLAAKDPDARFASAADVRVALTTPDPPRRAPYVALGIALAIGGVFAAALGTSSREPAAVTGARERHVAGAQRLFDEGEAAFTAGRYDDAAELYRRALGEMPAPAIIWDVAVSYEKVGKLDEARYWYERFVETSTDPKERAQGQDKLRMIDQQSKRP
ncbi:MAG TPA: serine/threonine-protein kinase [Kofleriaceae bacterium]|nr:serine/threonine-protein kinase [Kofleriaceae bacterium]